MVATVRNLTSASATSEYFRNEGGYYLEEGEGPDALKAKREEHREASAWHGEGARALGLEPGKRVAAGKFEKLLRGYVPGTDLRLGRMRDGQHEHRPGFDITFSAPKSVSLAALLPTAERPRGDRAVIRAHDEAVRATLDWIEATMLQTRGWDPATRRRPRVSAPAMAAATFRHIASRNLDPQLHTHAVIANVTRDAEGRWKSVEPTLIHRNARLIGAYYRNELSRRLIEKGYSVLPAMAGRVPSFEIAGYGREVCEAFSTRRRDMLAYLERKGLQYTTASAQIAALAERKEKAEPVRAILQRQWAERARGLGLDRTESVTLSTGAAELAAVPSALEIVGQGMRHLEERQSVFAAGELEAFALAHSPGRHTIGEIRDAVEWMVRDGHLVEAGLRRTDRAFVTDRALKAERSVIAMMKAGIGQAGALVREEEVSAHLDGAGLTEGQEEAVRTVLLARDRTVGVQGRAGTGKTAMLRQVRELAGERPVVGLAPSSSSSRVLERETGIHARTLQWFLTRCRGAAANGGADDRLKELFGGSVLVLDEASMTSTDQMRSLMRIADGLGVARLVLVGDTRQLRAVDAGQPFRQLQQAGMTTARMDDILRQKNPELRAAVEAALAGEPAEAVEMLGSGAVEVGHDELAVKAAETWLALDPVTRDGTLLLAPTHALRDEINRTVREALAEEGVLRGRTLTIDRLVNLGMTRAERGDVRNYREDDEVVFNQDLVNYRLRKDEVLTVTGIDGDRVELRHPDGKPRRIRPAGSIRYRFDVYETREIELRAGDRIRWTRNDRKRTLINGEKAEVIEIAKGRVRLRLEDGRTVSLADDDPQLRHIDHAWSSTVHGAQGLTADGVIAVLDSSHRALTDQSTFYVEISRARRNAVVLTDNLDQLVEVLMANTGEIPTAWEAKGERIEPDPEVLARALREKAPVWAPREEWAALEARARREGTVLFLMEEYGALVGRARELSEIPDLAADAREFADGLLVYDRACREEGKAAEEFDGLIGALAERRRVLNAEAVDRAVAGLAEYGEWRGMADRLRANGPAVLAHPAVRDAEMAGAIAGRLDRMCSLLDLDDAALAFETLRGEVAARADAAGTVPFHAGGHGDLLQQARELAERPRLPEWLRRAVDETIADAETCEGLCTEIRALQADTDRLLEERAALEAAAGLDPPTTLDAHAGWRDRCEAAEIIWQAMRDDPGTWQPHLDALEAEAAAIGTAINRFEALRGHDAAWAELVEAHGAMLEEAAAQNRMPFDLEGWGALVDKARALAETPDIPDGAERAARRVLEDDRSWGAARTEIDRFLDAAKPHGEYWDALRRVAEPGAGAGEAVPVIDLPSYRPLRPPERALRDTGRAILDDEARYGLHLDRIADGRETVAGALHRLDAHALADRCAGALEELERTERAAVGQGIALSGDAACRNAQRQARRLVERDDMEEAMRRRLETELAAQADRAAVWLDLLLLAREMEALDREHEEVLEEAARRAEAAGQDVPRPLLAEWRGWEERARTFVDEAGWVRHDLDLLRGWEGLTDLPARVGEELERMGDRLRLPAHEEARLDRMLEAETARLRDADAGHEYEHDWWGQEPLAEGDRLRLSEWRDGPGREAVVVWPGVDGGRAPGARVALEWAGLEGSAEWVPARELAGSGVRRASWSDGRLRDAVLARADASASPDMPLDCRDGLVAGDRVRWIEMVVPGHDAREGTSAGMGRPMAVTVEAEVIGRSVGPREEEDRCTLRECWRSDGAEPGRAEVPFGLLMAGGATCAFRDDREVRERQLREQERRRIALQQEEREAMERQRVMVMRLGMGL